MMSSLPSLVSIGLPTYNRVSSLKRALDSLLAQTYSNFEIIVSDDASQDATPAVCQEYCEKDRRVRCIRQQKNLGTIGNFYFVFGESRGKYFMRAADDDWYHHDFVRTLLEALEKNPSYAVAASSFHRVYDNGEIEKTVLLDGALDLTRDGYFKVYKKVLLRKRGIDHFTYGLFRREFLEKILEKPLPARKGWDIIMVSEMALAGHFYSVKPALRFSNNKMRSPGEYHDSLILREQNRPIKPKYRFVSTTYANLFLQSLRRVFSSKAIPRHRKLFVFIPWCSALWTKRRKFFGFFYGDARRFFNAHYWRLKFKL